MNRTCYLFGSKSLLIQCFKVMQDNDFTVKAVISDDTSITDWAVSQNIPIFKVCDQERLVSLGEVDYIFSITHLKIIPSGILKLAKNTAINFHDGLLPGYAGLNVTTWALYNRQSSHGVTWHEMTDAVDEGQVLKQVEFDLDTQETAFTLNARCYEAALSSFNELISELVSHSLNKQPQDAGKSVFYRGCQRIPGMAVLDWRLDAEKLLATIRALHFGPYSNPISLPKILLDKAVYYVHEAEIVDTAPGKPGEIMSASGTLEISAANRVISIKQLINTQGTETSISELVGDNSLKQGDTLPFIDDATAAKLTERDENFCKHEDNWLERLQNTKQLVVPIASHSSSDKPSQTFETSVQSLSQAFKSIEEQQSLLCLFFSRLSCQPQFNLYFYQQNNSAINDLLIENCLPVEFDLNYEQPVSDLLKSGVERIQESRNSGGYCKDLIARHPELHLQNIAKTLVITETDNAESLSGCSNSSLMIAVNPDSSEIYWHYNNQDYTDSKIQQLQSLLSNFSANVLASPAKSLTETNLLSAPEYDRLVNQWNQTDSDYNQSNCIHQLFEEQASNSPSSVALSFSGVCLSYEELNSRANKVAHYLLAKGVKPDQLVGVLLDRSVDMIVAMMGILKSGAAYLPLDPTYPKDRIEYMLEDGEVAAVLSQAEHVAYLDEMKISYLLMDDEAALASLADTNPQTAVNASNLAYTIYTSGSTGKPKGVMVEHGNVVNFFHGMSQNITDPQGVWLAVTSISFDISVLEIFWTLANGYEVALYADSQRKSAKKVRTAYPETDIEFSLFYWNVADDESEYDDDAYRLLIESAKFGDRNQFKAVWTPERHFHSFGGLYPNPSVTSAALAAVTENIHIRAGSCVVPLHHPIRVAEDWSMIDNISHGRVGLAVAAGWQPNDFVIMPQNHADAKNVMFESLETVQKLWKGETLEFPGPKGDMVKVRTLPRPVQKELPVWVTTAGNPDTFKQAGEKGASILTHLLGQSVDDVAKNIEIYREAYKSAGFEGNGHVTLLLHTLVGKDEEKVKELARAPMKKYLKSAMFLVKAAAWHFPTFKDFSESSGKTLDEFFETISDEDFDAILEFAFLRYYETSGLFGTPERCLSMVDKLKEIGVNEIGCLIDYGLETDRVLEHLPHLNELRKVAIKQQEINSDAAKELSISEIIDSRNVTHLQCTPSMANMLVADHDTSDHLKKLKHMMVGGEAFPVNLAKELTARVQDKVTNMYGPTETTIWSTIQNIRVDDDKILIGKPIANTQVYVLDKFKQPVPVNVPGELYISGDGVVRGYHKRKDLTDERFVKNPFVNDNKSRMYSTGDLVQYTEDGSIEYLGRIDHQIKIRGYRIELGEIESLLLSSDSVAEVVVVLREDTVNDKRLVAYIKPASNAVIDQTILKSKLSADLPEFMIPSIFVELDKFPLTPNGKIDRNALPAPEQKKDTVKSVAFVKPENELQEQIVSTWQSVLGLEKIGLDDNFFDIGGHSLLVVEVLSSLRQHIEKPIKMTDMFRFPTIRQFSNYLGAEDEVNQKMSDSQDRADARKSARKTAMNRRRARQK